MRNTDSITRIVLILCNTISCVGLSSEIHEAIAGKDATKVAAIVRDEPSSVNARDKYGTTPLICAVYGHQVALVRFLIDSGADVEARDSKGVTALIAATGSLRNCDPEYIETQVKFMRASGQPAKQIEEQRARLAAIYTPQAKEDWTEIARILESAIDRKRREVTDSGPERG